MYSAMHLQEAALFLSRQSALMPHGEGLQGCTTSMRCVAEMNNVLYSKPFKSLTCNATAAGEGISLVFPVANTDWDVVSNPA